MDPLRTSRSQLRREAAVTLLLGPVRFHPVTIMMQGYTYHVRQAYHLDERVSLLLRSVERSRVPKRFHYHGQEFENDWWWANAEPLLCVGVHEGLLRRRDPAVLTRATNVVRVACRPSVRREVSEFPPAVRVQPRRLRPLTSRKYL